MLVALSAEGITKRTLLASYVAAVSNVIP